MAKFVPMTAEQIKSAKALALVDVPLYSVGVAFEAGVRAGEKHHALCTNSDSWNCKYCEKTATCEALKDDRNFSVPKPPKIME